MSVAHYVASDYAQSILDYDEVMNNVVCEDCEEVRKWGDCPVGYEYTHTECPRKGFCDGLVSDIEKLLNSYGIY